ncbi:hypothetical protein MJO28_014198 [Puccinia striiformis f. sp. tritici]|uniref:NADH dehydrogenase [ubiquinone] 1 beta subcomplex subunit 9 n=4 Tax=Puccinia striiformis TaxID=27350 RepID=A0A0L0W471_9BASI|nr:hypothetical protein Pst134EA_026667 [Puccinia striiformis f. sp. tritici]KAI9616403.1 hypothetical protein H4Q26_010795 [Puccinia striiformis f. sp. tritici PST-130]KNF06272.1 hypothetical protein PSTG_00779 [Puccinia striiformis f. sp. tritici PST-78]POW05854.1 hypothetical protein PSTT_09432 [Puccinia striiformis]KAH9449954.1 hypothetical protein Pst134EA_026667 [Puccinia striiformis f. sp. tritici]KAI7938619.1 hypothetical protein MJO28_014198 [Puccinia striiformis f. sp. tritici]
MASPSSVVKPFTDAHRIYVQRLYRRALKQSLDWVVFRDIWRQKAIEIRVKFERNRDVRDPRAVKKLLHEAEVQLAETEHPDPYRPATAADGTKWERNLPPPMFSEEDRQKAREAFCRPRGLTV